MIKELKRVIRHAGKAATEHVKTEARYWEATRRVLPMRVAEAYDHIKLDDETFMTCLVVGVPTEVSQGYPNSISPSLIGGLLDTARERCAIGYSFSVRPFSQGESESALQEAEFQNVADQIADKMKNKLGHVTNRNTFVAEDLREDQRRIYQQEVSMSYTSCIITIRGNTLDELDIATSHVESVVKKNLVGVIEPFGKMLDVYRGAQPLAEQIRFCTVDALTHQVAAMLPMQDPGAKTDDMGVWFGTNKMTHNDVIIDVEELATQHMIIVGPSGSGKTTFETVIGSRFKEQLGYRVVYVTMKSDDGTQFRNTPKQYGTAGGIIDVGSGPGKTVINPLQIVTDSTILQTEEEYLRTYYDHKANVVAFFDAFIRVGLSQPQKNYLDDTLNTVYEKAGIISMTGMRIRTNPETWADGDNFPTIHMLRKLWYDDMKAGGLKLLQMTAESIYNNTQQLDLSGAYSYLNTKTTADFSKDYIVIDLSGLKSDLQDAMSVLITGIIAIRFRADAEKKTMLIIDEGVAFVRNPERMRFVADASMMGRSLKVAMCICFTHTADLTEELASMIQTNSMISVVLGRGMGLADAENTKRFFHIPDVYMADIIDQPVGDGLLMVGRQVIPMHFDVTDQEMSVLKGGTYIDEKHPTDDAFNILGMVSNMAIENGFVLNEWIENPNPVMMKEIGYVPHLVNRTLGNGKIKAWVQSDIIDENDMVGNQTLDHYSSVIQIAGYLMLSGFDDVVVSHYDNADVTCRVGDDLFAFEYERPGSHTKQELQAKKIKLETTGKRCFFVCQSSYKKFVESAVGDCTYTRGANIKAAIDAVLSDHQKGDEEQ